MNRSYVSAMTAATEQRGSLAASLASMRCRTRARHTINGVPVC